MKQRKSLTYLRKLGGIFCRKGFLYILLLSLVVAACDDHEEMPEPSSDESRTYEAGFYISVGDNAPVDGSRATPADGTYDRGAGFENYIDVAGGDYRFLFFDDDNRFMGEFKVSGVVAVESPYSSKRYHVLGRIENVKLRNTTFKVVAVANWGNYPKMTVGVSTIDDLAKTEFDFSDPFMPTEQTPIPLFGVKSFTNVSFDNNNFAYIGTIHLIRALAKVEVQCPTEGWTLKTVRMTRYNKSGYSAPGNVYEEKHYVKNSYDGDYVDDVSVPADAEQGESLAFTESTLPSGKSVFTVYVPEFINVLRGADGKTTALDSRAQIEVTFVENQKTYLLEFDSYKDGAPAGEPFDINRNYWYRYTINKGAEWGDVNVEVDIEPYSLVTLNPDYGLERDENGYIIYYRDPVNGTVYLLDPDIRRCFTIINSSITEVDRIWDRALGKYIHWYADGESYFYDRTYKRYYTRCENGSMFYVSDVIDGEEYYFDIKEMKYYHMVGGTKQYETEIIDNSFEKPKPAYSHYDGIAYFLDRENGEYYYRTPYGEYVYVSEEIDGIRYIYDPASQRYYIDGTHEYVDRIVDSDGTVMFVNSNDVAYFLDRARGEYNFRNHRGEKVYVTMTVNGRRYFYDRNSGKNMLFWTVDGEYASARNYIYILTDQNLTEDNNTSPRIVYSHVNGYSYFWDYNRRKYYYLDASDEAVYLDNLPNN